MFLMINGAFGIGKTTVAARLVAQCADTRVFDPERIGFILRRLPAWSLGRRRQPDDFQDLYLWRSLSIAGARRAHRRHSPIIVPMAFSNLDYLKAFQSALGEDGPVLTVCLVAPLGVIARRLAARAAAERRTVTEWQKRRSEECWHAHRSADFGIPIDATRPVDTIVADLQQRISRDT